MQRFVQQWKGGISAKSSTVFGFPYFYRHYRRPDYCTYDGSFAENISCPFDHHHLRQLGFLYFFHS
uniref:Uncharacterized protein n=1 Tax=Aegilops tauschii subsp. strangulata TaxID=200361 RepID=A0A453J9L2_AEGTS